MNLRLSPKLTLAVLCLFLVVAGFFSYRYMTEPETWQGDKEIFVQRAREGLEKPAREKLSATGMDAQAIDKKIAAMWKSGELKLPKGEPGVHWFTDPKGNVQIIPGPEDLLKGASVPGSPPAAKPVQATPP